MPCNDFNKTHFFVIDKISVSKRIFATNQIFFRLIYLIGFYYGFKK